MTRIEERDRISAALAAIGIESCYGKDGFWIRGRGWITFTAARRLAGVKPDLTRTRRERILYGDAAWIDAISGKM